jgi:phosphoglycolate phosphatase
MAAFDSASDLPTFDLVIFDLDGTVVDSLPDIAAALNRTLQGAGREPLPQAQIQSYVGDGAARLVQRALPDGFPADALARLIADFRIQYAAGLCVETRPYPGIDSLLQRFAAAMPLAIFTNKPGDLARPLLRQLELDRYFAHIIGDGDGYARKPAPDAGRWLVERYGGDARRALVVGDGVPDMRFAHALGAGAAAVSWGYSAPERLAAENPTWTVDRPADLIDIVLASPDTVLASP